MAAPIVARQASPVDGMLSSLGSEKASVRIWGLMQIAKVGEGHAAQYQLDVQVTHLMDDPDMGVQEQALKTLSQMGSRAGRHCDLISKKLATGSKDVKLAALAAFGTLGPVACNQALEIQACLEDADLDLVAGACKALGGIQATSMASRVASKLNSPDVEVAVAACESLSAMNRETQAVAALLSHSQPQVKAAAAKGLKGMTRAEEFSKQLSQLVGDQDCYVRIGAAESLVAMGGAAPEVLGGYLSASNPGVVAAAANVLGSLGAAAAPQAGALEAALLNQAEDKSTQMLTAAGVMPKVSAELRKPACAAAMALGSLGNAKSAPKLVERLNSQDWEIRAAAVTALGHLAADSSRFESEILELLKDPSPVVVASACRTLGLIAAAGTPSSSSAASVAELLEHLQPAVRASAATALGEMGEEAEAFIEPLCKLFNDKAWTVQVAAIKTVSGSGELGQMFAADVCRLVFNGNSQTRVAAIDALTKMGARGACFADELEPLLDDAMPEVRDAAQKALALMAANQPSVPALPSAASVPEPAPAISNGPVAPSTSSTSSPPPLPVGLLFPGQGSQYVKMLAEVKDLPKVKSMLATAKDILGYDMLKLCLEGPEEQLEQTKYCQPAMYIGGLAGLELLRQEKPAAAERPQAVAGLSLGEYTALTAAGVFDFETGLKLVKLRGEAMQEAAQASPQMMISVAGLDQQTLDKLCKESLSGPKDICQVANFLFPNGFSCAGSKDAAEKLMEKALATNGCLQAKALKTSGAFHTDFMLPARARLVAALKEAEPMMKPPTCEVYMNLTGKRIAPGTPVAEILSLMGDQLTNCVLWEPSMKAMLKDGINEFYECGPMKQLKAMMKRIDMDAWKKTQNIHV